MKFKKKNVLVVLLGLIIMVLLVKLLLLPYIDYKGGVCNVAINGDRGTIGKNYSELNDYLQSCEDYEVDDVNLKTIITYDFSELVDDLSSQSFSTYLKSIDDNKLYNKDYWEYSIKTAELYNLLEEYNKTKTDSIDASYVINNNRFVLVNNTIGTKVDSQSFVSSITSSLEKYGFLSDELKVSDFYIQPEITDDTMQKTLDDANKYAEWYVQYSNGSKYCINVKNDVTIDYINGGFEMTVDSGFLAEIVKEIDSKYTNVGGTWDFKTTDGDNIQVTGGTWGTQVDKDAELLELQNLFANLEVVDNREPVYSVSNNDIGSTYVEVSIKDQHVWLYENGVCTMDSDCVTGDSKQKHDTPTGVYFISERINGKYLRGDGYKTWVNKWMRITNRGHGLHDAYWRSNFGGNIYKSNGSHGCVNLPSKFASDLYDKTYRGMPVIIY